MTDKEIINSLIEDSSIDIEDFFFKKCSAMLDYVINNVFNGKADKDELISELYLYLRENDWQKLRQFQFKCKLTTWLSVVAARFFIKKRNRLIVYDYQDTLLDKNAIGRDEYNQNSYLDREIDVRNAILMMRNERYQMVITELDIKDTKPEDLAQQMGITVDNLYNIHKRAYAQLGIIIKRREDYSYD